MSTPKPQNSLATLVRYHPGFIFKFILLWVQILSTVQHTHANNNSSTSPSNNPQLNCQPGEQRQFSYESSTKVWGSSNQQVLVRATISLKCMEPATNSTLKYLAEILEVIPVFSSDFIHEQNTPATGLKQRLADTESSKMQPDVRARDPTVINSHPFDARAEPLLEEVGQAAYRVKRSVSGWFSKAWISVREFFGNLFKFSERSSISRDQAIRDSGLDIASQCKPGSKPSNALPFDDSVFEDIGPEYYVSASSFESPTVYKHSGDINPKYLGLTEDNDLDQEEVDSLSFFNDPKPASGRQRRSASGKESALNGIDQERLLKIPFVFSQSRSGQIVELRFSADDFDTSVKNFKRHLCDLFATNLAQTDSNNTITAREISPIGQHETKYQLGIAENSMDTMRASLLKWSSDSSGHKKSSNEQLVRALAIMGDGTKRISHDSESGNPGDDQADIEDDNHEKSAVTFSVVRSINTTSPIQLSSNAIAPHIGGMLVRVSQVQQITSGRLMGTAGQLSMSLMLSGSSQLRRERRNSEEREDDQIDELPDFLRVSASFAMRLMPVGETFSRLMHRSGRSRFPRSPTVNRTQIQQTINTKQRGEMMFKPYSRDPDKRRQILQQWQAQESSLQMSVASLMVENESELENELERLSVMRNQIRLRLNEEILRNRIRRSISESTTETSSSKAGQQVQSKFESGGDFGLGLSQLILGTGITTKSKGSIYQTIEETIELENSLDKADDELAVGRLMRGTIRQEFLREHCRASLPPTDELDLIYRQPDSADKQRATGSSFTTSGKSANLRSSTTKVQMEKFERKFAQCRNVLKLMLLMSHRRSEELVIELYDECNKILLELTTKTAEFPRAPVANYYRSIRGQLVDIMAQIDRPSDRLIDLLFARLYYPNWQTGPTGTKLLNGKPEQLMTEQSKFVYVGANTDKRSDLSEHKSNNKSLLRDEHSYNKSESAGHLVSTLTKLAARPSVSRKRRDELIDKLLLLLKASECQIFNTLDLDIIESMANFQGDLNELAIGRIISLARRCKTHDQFVVACVHGLVGHSWPSRSQRYLDELLRSSETSCTVKSEILLSLMTTRLGLEFKSSKMEPTSLSAANNFTTDRIDKTLNELLTSTDKSNEPDRLCLRQLATRYLDRNSEASVPTLAQERIYVSQFNQVPVSKRRQRRAVMNSDNFWDEAHCKRWSLLDGDSEMPSRSSAPDQLKIPRTNRSDAVDEIDDNSIMTAIMNQRTNKNVWARTQRDLPVTGPTQNSTNQTPPRYLRRRHKCTAAKRFGPRNVQATVRAELVNDLVGERDENKFLARFRLSTNFLGNNVDVGRMYLWHQRSTTRAYAHILGHSVWDTSQSCRDPPPHRMLYMPLFNFNLWLLKVSFGLRLNAEMGFFPNCVDDRLPQSSTPHSGGPIRLSASPVGDITSNQLQLNPTISLRASGEATAKFVVARTGLSVASNYGYQGSIRVGQQPESCMSVHSSHQPMNVTVASWFQLWDNSCHFWGSRESGEPRAVKWRLGSSNPIVWLDNECMTHTTKV